MRNESPYYNIRRGSGEGERKREYEEESVAAEEYSK